VAGFVALLDAVVVSAVLLVALFAVTVVIRPLLVAVLSRAPLIGGWLASNVDAGLNSFVAVISAPLNASLPVVVGLVEAVWGAGYWFAQWLIVGFEAIPAAVAGFITVSFPYALNQIQQFLEGLINAARTYALGLVQSAEALAQALFSQAEALAQALFNTAISTAINLFHTAEADAAALVKVAEYDAGQLWRQAETDAQGLFLQAEGVAHMLFSDFVAFIMPLITKLIADVQAIEAQLNAFLPEWIKTVERDISAISAQLNAQPDEFKKNLQKEIADLEASPPWLILEALLNGAEAAGGALPEEIARATWDELRSNLRNFEATVQAARPTIDKIIAEIESGL
jgi:hypothetical protein